ncbi:alpha/beta fold hydrolase [Granulicella arctica]|uniref:alpha/beta fold hydrolase n=1 Tax=Granulicella arctica TaxID=940613 RepID=UPI0021DF9BA0|nr:alpha/beta fold hydrolase [Granulicella arctica]
MRHLLTAILAAASVASATRVLAQKPTPLAQPGHTVAPIKWPTQDGAYDIPGFHFKDGETIAKLHLHYLTLGTPHRDTAGLTDNAVLLLHGTGGDANSLLAPQFSTILFGPGQPLDITKYYVILPDDIGHGSSSKPSDGLHMHFPQYDYDDMVASQHAMLLDGLHVDHLRLILGTSMGCMQAFVWGETYTTFVDALAPFACLPVELAGRNRMMRYMAIQNIKLDPAWKNGDYTTEPIQGLRGANELLLAMGSAPLQMQKNFPTRIAAEQYVDTYLERTLAHTDANDLVYYINASRNYNPLPKLSTITTPVLWINSADDFINPPELGIAQATVTKMPHAKFILIPISDATRGHGTHTQAAVWKDYLVDFLAQTAKK